MAIWYGSAESDGYNALVLNAGLAWRDIALLRALSRYLRQAGIAFSQSYMWATLNRHPAIAGALVELFHARFAPGRADEDAATGRLPAIEAALEAVESLDEDRIIRRFANRDRRDACAPTSSSSRADGAPARRDRFKLDSSAHRRPAAAEAVPRNLRLQPARRGRASPLRPRRARRHPLVGPAAGFPHRGARPRQGAAGQERRDRAGRRQGRLRAEEAAGRRRRARRSLAEGDGGLPHLHAPPPRPHRQSRRRRASCRRQGVVRHDGDDPYLVVAADKGTATFSDTRQRASRSSAASGSATPSPAAARPATTTRRWASRRAAPGRR